MYLINALGVRRVFSVLCVLHMYLINALGVRCVFGNANFIDLGFHSHNYVLLCALNVKWRLKLKITNFMLPVRLEPTTLWVDVDIASIGICLGSLTLTPSDQPYSWYIFLFSSHIVAHIWKKVKKIKNFKKVKNIRKSYC